MWIRHVIVVRIELHMANVLLEKSHGTRAGKLLAPSPHQVQPLAEDSRESIDVLVPGAVEIAEEEQVIVFQFFPLLTMPQERQVLARHNHPSRKFNERQVDQILLRRLHTA